MGRAQSSTQVVNMRTVLMLLLLVSLLLRGESLFCEEGDFLQDPLGVEPNEVLILSRLIDVQERRLATQKELCDKMELFRAQKEAFIEGDISQFHALTMVNNARDILGLIQEGHLAYLFPSVYLEELVFFSSIAGKSAPARP